MKKLKCAVVGVGYLGRVHAQKYKTLADTGSHIELIGVCDANADRVAEIARELATHSFSNYKDLIGQVDAVTIAASTRTHFEIAKFFLENGVHVHVEKPLPDGIH